MKKWSLILFTLTTVVSFFLVKHSSPLSQAQAHLEQAKMGYDESRTVFQPQVLLSDKVQNRKPGPPGEDFLVLLRKQKLVLSLMPTLNVLQSLPTREVHFPPQQLQAAALALGDLAQWLEDHPELALQSLEFYKTCTEHEDFPSSVRASCLLDLRTWTQRLGLAPSDVKVPKSILDLAAKAE